jgi:hypothetical protein
MQRLATTGGKKRQVEATNCDKFVAAFCRILLLGFEPHFFQTVSLGDGVSLQNVFPDGSYQRHFTVGANVGNCYARY